MSPPMERRFLRSNCIKPREQTAGRRSCAPAGSIRVRAKTQVAGHDINYIAISGALYVIGRADLPPVPPANYVGDFGGGGMLLVVGNFGAGMVSWLPRRLRGRHDLPGLRY